MVNKTQCAMFIVLVVGTLCGCVDRTNNVTASQPANANQPSPPDLPDSPPPQAASGSALQAKDPAHSADRPKIKAAPSWNARLAELSDSDRDYMKRVDDRYLGILQFRDADEQRRLIAQGYPMPEEWLAARDLSDEDLAAMADAGDVNAKLFLADRISERLAPIQASRRPDVEPALPENDIITGFARSNTAALQALRASDSPFAAYVYGRTLSAGTWGAPPEPVAAGIALARDRGDDRASSILAAFERAHPGMDPAYIRSVYAGAAKR